MGSVRHALRRAGTVVTTLGVGLGGLMVASTSPTQAAGGLVETDYGFQGTAYGTQVLSQGSGLTSGKSAFSVVSCTRLVGEQSDEHLAAITLPAQDPSIQVQGISSANETFRRPKKGIDGAIRSTNSITRVVLGSSSTPQLEFDGLTTTSTAWATTTGKLKAKNVLDAGQLSLTGITDPGDNSPLGQLFDGLNGGIDQLVQVLQQNAGGIEIPGLGMVSLGYVRHSEHKNFAVAASFVIRVKLYGADGVEGGNDDTLVGIGHSRARINRDVPLAVMGGVGYGANAELLDGIVSVGKLGEQPLLCPGTRGKVFTSPLAGLDFPLQDNQFSAAGLRGKAFGDQDRRKAVAWTEGDVADLTLGPLELKGVVGRVNLEMNRDGKIVKRNIKGSSIGEVLVNGESQGSFDPSTAGQIPPVEIPGVARIDFFVKDKTTRGLRVSAVVITLADGSPGVSEIRLGNAAAVLKRR